MSYINDALKKARDGKNSRYENYSDIILPPVDVKDAHPQRKWVIGLTALMLFLTSSGVALYYYQHNNRAQTLTQAPMPQRQVMHPPTPTPLPDQPSVQAPLDVRTPAAPLPQHKSAQREATLPVPSPAKTSLKEQTLRSNNKLPQVEAQAEAVRFYREALALQRENRFAEAASLYKKTLSLDPKNVQALNNLGVVHMSQNRYDEAAIAFRQAILFKKDYVDPYYNLACLQAKWQNIDMALRYLKTAVSINSEVAEWARTDKDLNNLHASPEFRNLIEKRGDE